VRLSLSILLALVVGVVLCCPGPIWAQGRRGGGGNPHPPKQSAHPQQGNRGKQPNQGKGPGAPGPRAGGPRQIEEFMRMSPAEREREISKLPPERQERVRQRLQEYDRMPPAQKERLQRQWERLSELPPERQQQVRQSMRDFTQQPQERRQAMRRQLVQVQAMNPEERRAYFNSPEFKSQFSPDEQGIMKNMIEVLPPQ